MENSVSVSPYKNKALLLTVSYSSFLMLGIYLAFFQYTVLSMTDKFILSAGMVGMFAAVQSIGMVISPFVLGVLSGRIGKKRTILISYSLIVAGMLLAGSSQSIALYICSIFLVGAGYAVTEATTSAVLSDEFQHHATRHLNFSQVFFSLGAFFGPYIAEWLIVRQGIYFQNLYYFLAVPFLIIAVFTFFTKHYNDHAGKQGMRTFSVLGKLKDYVILLLLISFFLYVGIETTTANYIDSYFELSLGMPQLSHTALAFFWLAMVPSRFLAGLIMKNTKGIFIGLCMLTMVSLILAMLLKDPTAKIAMFALCGFGCGPMWPLIADRIAKRSKGHTAPMLNIAFAFCGFGATVLPFIAGLFVDAFSPAATYYMCAAAVLVALVLFLFAVRREEAAQA